MGELAEIEIGICSSCMAKWANTNTPPEFDKFVADVKTELEARRPDRVWNISTQSCFRLCPEQRITISVAHKLTMTRNATVDSVALEILSFLKPVKTT